jgi:hypothetical protein
MFEAKVPQTSPARRFAALDQGAITFTHGHDFGIPIRKELAKAPHATHVSWIVRTSPVQPCVFELGRSAAHYTDDNFEELSADRA